MSAQLLLCRRQVLAIRHADFRPIVVRPIKNLRFTYDLCAFCEDRRVLERVSDCHDVNEIHDAVVPELNDRDIEVRELDALPCHAHRTERDVISGRAQVLVPHRVGQPSSFVENPLSDNAVIPLIPESKAMAAGLESRARIT